MVTREQTVAGEQQGAGDRISALMDGEFGDVELLASLERTGRDEEMRETWAVYHLIGEALRGEGLVQPGLQTRIVAKLAEEPTVLAPKPRTARFGKTSLGRAGMAIAASVATLSVVAWMANQQIDSAPGSIAPGTVAIAPVNADAVTTQSPTQMVAQTPAEPAAGQPLNEYLLAHEELSPYGGNLRFATTTSIAPAIGVSGR